MQAAWIAFKSKDKSIGTGGWIKSEDSPDDQSKFPYQSVTETDYATAAGADPPTNDDHAGPPKLATKSTNFYYIPVWEFSAEAKRDYGGINSSGGPQVSGRSDQSDFSIEIPSSVATPILYEYCCSGKQFAWVHVFAPNYKSDSGASLHIRLKDVSVTGFEFSAVNWMRDDLETDSNGHKLMKYNAGLYDVGHFDDVTLLYTSIEFETKKNDGTSAAVRGWDTGTDAASPTRPTSPL